MTVEEYKNLTGITVSASREKLVYAQIQRTQAILENMLGYSLEFDLLDLNEYEEEGQLDDTCPCSCTDTDPDLDPADAVVFAYRLFPYNAKDRYLSIDPASSIHAVKLVKNGVTYKTLDEDDYRLDSKRGIIKFLEQCDRWCSCKLVCDCVQLAVDATWLWPEDEMPIDLQTVWADMVTYYADGKKDVRSETLGPHSYTKFDRQKPETISENMAVIQRYAGPNGTASRMPI